MLTVAVVLNAPEQLELRHLPLPQLGSGEVMVDVQWSAISTGTERVLWSGNMPPFPGMGYPLVPGYESVGRVVQAEDGGPLEVGDTVFVPGANCFGEVRGLFGGAASRLIVPAARAVRINDVAAEEGVLLALAATARHALTRGESAELIVGHGVLGRLLARLCVAEGGNPVVWETNPNRHSGAHGYRVVTPGDDPRRDYRTIYDVSGDARLLPDLIGRLARGGEIVLAGFYERIEFPFPPAFMKEARLRVASEFQPADLLAVATMVSSGKLKLDGLITHRMPFSQATTAYETAFTDPDCLKMLLEWRTCE